MFEDVSSTVFLFLSLFLSLYTSSPTWQKQTYYLTSYFCYTNHKTLHLNNFAPSPSFSLLATLRLTSVNLTLWQMVPLIVY